MGIFQDLKGTSQSDFRLGLAGVRLKNTAGSLLIRNNADTADSDITANQVAISGNVLLINSDAANSGADWLYTLQRPATGMAAAVILTLPPTDGSPGQVLATDGNGVLDWSTVAGSSNKISVDTTSIAFGSGATVAAFTLPANAVVTQVEFVIETPFDANPTASVGTAGSTSKYMASTQVDLKGLAKDRYQVHPGEIPLGTTEDIIISYVAGGATVGAARCLISYVVPD